ncbi:MAG: hypothetical protein ACOYIR_00235 [Christensenellales bacterium]|jgi:hypothetical protein
MAKSRYSSGIGTKIFIGSAVGILLLAVVLMIFSLSKSGRFNSFKKELTAISGGVKSKIFVEYRGETSEITKKEFGRVYALLISARRRDHVGGAKITDTCSIHISNIGGEEGVLTIDKTDTEYIKVTYQSSKSEYIYWFQCAFGSILNLAGATAK